jgi:hypothetical protein
VAPDKGCARRFPIRISEEGSIEVVLGDA